MPFRWNCCVSDAIEFRWITVSVLLLNWRLWNCWSATKKHSRHLALSKLAGGSANSMRLQSNHMSTCKMKAAMLEKSWIIDTPIKQGCLWIPSPQFQVCLTWKYPKWVVPWLHTASLSKSVKVSRPQLIRRSCFHRPASSLCFTNLTMLQNAAEANSQTSVFSWNRPIKRSIAPVYLSENVEPEDFSDLGGSKNRGTPKSSILIRFSIINHPFWGAPVFRNIHL